MTVPTTSVSDGKPRAKWFKVTAGNSLSAARPPGEEISFPSGTIDLGASSFLIPRPREIQPATVSGFLALPPGNDPLPVVILMHGCNGISGIEIAWVTTLNGLGIATFVVDSFRRRGIAETCSGKERLNFASRMTDAFAALDLLVTNPRIDAGRIAIMGFSLGGEIALRTSQLRFQKHFAKGAGRFAAHLAFYPARVHHAACGGRPRQRRTHPDFSWRRGRLDSDRSMQGLHRAPAASRQG